MVAASPSTVSFRANDHPTASKAKAALYLNEMAKARDKLSLIRYVTAAAMGTGGVKDAEKYDAFSSSKHSGCACGVVAKEYPFGFAPFLS